MTALLLAYTAFVAMVADLAHAAVGLVVAFATPLLTDPNLLDSVSWGLVLGVVMPILTSIVQQPKWSSRTRTIVAWVLSAVGGVVTCLANGSFHEGQTLVATIAVVLVASQATYIGWKKTGLTGSIESATSPGSTNSTQ